MQVRHALDRQGTHRATILRSGGELHLKQVPLVLVIGDTRRPGNSSTFVNAKLPHNSARVALQQPLQIRIPALQQCFRLCYMLIERTAALQHAKEWLQPANVLKHSLPILTNGHLSSDVQ